MLKSVAPLWEKLQHLQRPHMFMHSATDTERPTLGQHLAEQVAGGVGSWVFIGVQALLMLAWIVFNALALTGVWHFDPYPYIALNLAMSAEAAFTGPILLIAANVGATRDHHQADRVEHLVAQNEQLGEQNKGLVEQLVTVERLIDEHIAQSMTAHSAELRAVYELMREVHQQVTHNAAVSPECLLPAEPVVVSPEPANEAVPPAPTAP
jgi:uncharacterized membrane protein